MNAAELVPCPRDLYSRLPEMYFNQPWELQSAPFMLGYTDDLADEKEIAAAVEVARGDWPKWRPAAWLSYVKIGASPCLLYIRKAAVCGHSTR